MTRGRILTAFGVLVLVGVGLTVLMAARGAGDRAEPGGDKPRATKLVFVGEVDTEARTVALYPENFPQPARVIEVLVKEGAKVKKGQPLLKFDTELLQLKVEEAGRALAAAQFEQAKAESAVRVHKTEILFNEFTWKAKQKDLENKQNEFKEAQRAHQFKVITQTQLEAAEAAVRAAELNLEAARVKLEGSRAEVPNYLVEQAKANIKRLETLKAEAEHARDMVACKAPADGRIIRSFVSDGHTFHPTSRDPAFWFVKDGPLIVRGEVTQEFASRISEGKNAEIRDEADSTQRWKGKVIKVGEQFLPRRHGGTSVLDFMPVSDDRVVECQISIEQGERAPKFGQKVRITVE
jgi:multidrug resistance efflux pump